MSRHWKAAVIGAGSESLHAIEKAREQGVAVTAYDGSPSAEGLAAADVGVVSDISKEENLVQELTKERPDFILSVPIGRYLTTIGAVNDALGLRGVSRKAAVLCTDKYAFHELISAAGYRKADCILFQKRMRTAVLLEQQVSYPAILKPRYGSGSRGIYYLADERDYKEALADAAGHTGKLPEDYVLEEAVPGEEYGVDAAVCGGEFHLVLLRRKLLTPLPERQAIGYLSVVPNRERELTDRVSTAMAEAARLIGLTDCLMHADIIVREETLFLIELSARPSGHNLHNLFTPLAAGVDMAGEYCRLQRGGQASFDPKETKKMLIRYFDFEDKQITAVPEEQELVLPKEIRLIRYACTIKPGDYMGKVPDGHSLMGRGYFILEGEEETELKEAAQSILDRFL